MKQHDIVYRWSPLFDGKSVELQRFIISKERKDGEWVARATTGNLAYVINENDENLFTTIKAAREYLRRVADTSFLTPTDK